MPEPFNQGGMEAPAFDAYAVTKSADPLPNPARGLYIGGAGNLTVTTAAGNNVTLTNVPAGSIIPLRVTHVLVATTATDIVALR